MIGLLLKWFLGGGASGIADIGKSLADGYATKQKALVDQHGIDVKAATEVNLKTLDTETRVTELYATQALADSKLKENAWMRKVAFIIAAYVMFCVALENTMPKLATLVGIHTTELPYPWNYVIPAIIIAVVGLRPFEKASIQKGVNNTQANIQKATEQRKAAVSFLNKREQEQS